MKKNLITVIIISLLSLCTIASSQDYWQVGDQVTDITLTTIDGDTIPIESLKGKVVYINFFATWCSPCMKEMVLINNELLPKFEKNENFYFIALGRAHTTEQLLTFKEKKNYNFNIGCDTNRIIFNHFSEKGIPLNIVIDKKGKIIYKKTGYSKTSFKKLTQTIKKSCRK